MKLNSEPKKVLLLSYAFSPLQAAESYLSAKALSNIDSYTIDVLTVEHEKLGMSIDNSLSEYTKNNFGRIYRTLSPFWINKKIFKLLRYVSFFPDRFRFFNRSIFKKFIDINSQNYDIIISWSQWHSIHLAALEIKKKYPSILWIAHFSDPWADNPFLSSIVGYKTLQYFLERRVIKYADAVNFTTHLTRMMVMKKYPKKWMNKTYVTQHSYDLSLYKDSCTNKTDNKFVISYFGNFYGPRNPIDFLKALENIYIGDNDIFNHIVFEFFGKWIGNESWNTDNISLPNGLVKVKSPVTYIGSLEKMKESDLLLILDANFENSVFFPSKLVDYIGAKKPILAITPKGSCANIVKEIGGIVCSPKTVKSIEAGIILAINGLKLGSLHTEESDSIHQFSNSFISNRFKIIFDQLIQK